MFTSFMGDDGEALKGFWDVWKKIRCSQCNVRFVFHYGGPGVVGRKGPEIEGNGGRVPPIIVRNTPNVTPEFPMFVDGLLKSCGRWGPDEGS